MRGRGKTHAYSMLFYARKAILNADTTDTQCGQPVDSEHSQRKPRRTVRTRTKTSPSQTVLRYSPCAAMVARWRNECVEAVG